MEATAKHSCTWLEFQKYRLFLRSLPQQEPETFHRGTGDTKQASKNTLRGWQRKGGGEGGGGEGRGIMGEGTTGATLLARPRDIDPVLMAFA